MPTQRDTLLPLYSSQKLSFRSYDVVRRVMGWDGIGFEPRNPTTTRFGGVLVDTRVGVRFF